MPYVSIPTLRVPKRQREALGHIVSILKTNEMREKAATQGAEVMGGTPQEFAARMRNDIEKWGKVTAALKLQPG